MRFHSSAPSITIPTLDLPTFVFNYAKENSDFGKNPDLLAISDDELKFSFSDVEKYSHLFASGLSNILGIKRGDVVAVALPNTAYYPIMTLGIQMIGAVCTTVNPAYTAQELAHQFELTEVKAVVTTSERIPVVNDALKIAKVSLSSNRILTVDGTSSHVKNIFTEQPFNRVYLKTEKESAETMAFIVFSSGTSGKPKGVMLSHRNIISNVLQNNQHEFIDKTLYEATNRHQRKTWIGVLPLFHIYGLTCILHLGLTMGCSVVVMRQFDLEKFCQLSQEHKACFAHLVPPIILGLAKHPIVSKYDLTSYAAINSGAAPLSKELQNEASKRINVPVIQGYGLSESSPVISRLVLDDIKPGSSGVLLANIEAKVVDENDKEVGVDEIGELCFKGPNIMLGYLKNPQATKETIDEEGFLHTGDVGYIDKTGNCFITDRKKELIKYKGFQVPPAELEGILTDHPAVIDSAVIPVYDESRASEIPKAFVVVHPDKASPQIGEEIKKWVDGRVVDYKRLRGGVEIIDAIPKSVSGKILRRVLKDREAMKRNQKAKL